MVEGIKQREAAEDNDGQEVLVFGEVLDADEI